MARPTLAGLIAAVLLGAAPQDDPTPPSLKQAGVCSRCHVAQVLEWSASKHTRAGTGCQSCHGPSAAHVANERNQVKPDRLPQGAAFTALCATCHASGCPKTRNAERCQSCHHQHALSHPEDRQMRPVGREEDSTAPEFARLLAEGERQVARSDWAAARTAFATALTLRPADRRVARRLRMTERRLRPEQPGFSIAGPEVDAESGLPSRVRVTGTTIEMLLVPGGEVEIGSDSFAASRPVHAVRVEPYYLAVTETTQQQWLELDPANHPSVHTGPALPVHNISWSDAQAWITRLNAKVAGGGFRLPTEAEWESASAGTQADTETAWFRDTAKVAGAGAGPFFESKDYAPRAVGTKKPNGAGFHDLLGNVNEWCSSLHRPYPYDARDGRESSVGEGLRVLRGGSYADSAGYLHASFRHSERPGRRNVWNGFRLARTVPR